MLPTVFRNLSGRTPLHEACARGLNDLILELFKYGASIQTRDSEGSSALHVSNVFLQLHNP